MIKKICCIAFSSLILMLFLSGCYNESGNGYAKLNKTILNVKPVVPNDISLSKLGYENVAFELFAKSYIAAEMNGLSNENNVTVSPLSFFLCASMLFNGAKNETLSEYEKLTKMSIEQANSLSSTLYDKYVEKEYKNTQVEIGNSIWINQDYADDIKDKYLVDSSSFYNADIYKGDFNNNNLVNAINNWVSYKTHKMINKIVDEVDPESVLSLINALYFNGKWEKVYDKSTSGLFVNKNKTTTNKEFLERNINNYYATDTEKAFLMPFLEGFSFVGILPESKTDFDGFASSFTAEKYDKLMASPIYKNIYGEAITVETAIPEMKLEFEIDLKPVMQQMGISKAFSVIDADFSDIVDKQNKQLFISQSKQKTVFELDKDGVKAAAVTYFKVTSLPPISNVISIRLDRPFLFGIVDNETKLPLFFGSVQSF